MKLASTTNWLAEMKAITATARTTDVFILPSPKQMLQSLGYTALVLVGSCHGRICIYRAADPALLPACLPTLAISQDFGDSGEHLTSYILSPHSLRGQSHHGWECCC